MLYDMNRNTTNLIVRGLMCGGLVGYFFVYGTPSEIAIALVVAVLNLLITRELHP